MGKHSVFLSIGSNVGDKRANLDLAVETLRSRNDMAVHAVSRYYRTQPQNYVDQDWFVNAAVKLETDIAPLELLRCA